MLILDEPASGLDPRSRVELRDLVRELGAEGKAVLVSSHVLAELDEMVDDAIFMSKGVTLGEAADAEVARARTRWRVVAVEGDLAAALANASRDFVVEAVPHGIGGRGERRGRRRCGGARRDVGGRRDQGGKDRPRGLGP